MFTIDNNTSVPIVVRLVNFEGVDSNEIALALQLHQTGDLGDLDDGVIVEVSEG